MAVLFGTLYPILAQAFGRAVSVGPPYYTLVFGALGAALMIILPAGPLLAWKRGDLPGVFQRLWWAALAALIVGALVFILAEPRKAAPAATIALAVWLIAGAVAEMLERGRVGRVAAAETGRRLRGLPRGAWGMTLAHAGLGVFLLGAGVDGGWRVETANVVRVGDTITAGRYQLAFAKAGEVDGSNYTAERAVFAVTRGGHPVCEAAPERRFYPIGGQTTSKVALCLQGVSDVYVVLGDRRVGPTGDATWLVRVFWNPWARLIFIGPLLMALGGAISLSDRRLRIGVPRPAPAVTPDPGPKAEPGLEPAE